jgi:hypothetical protein
MPLNQSHTPATIAYHDHQKPPATAELEALQSSIDSLGRKISRSPLANCDTRNLRETAEEIDDLLNRVFSVSQRLETEIAVRRRAIAPTYKITAVGLMLLDTRPVLTPEERVKLAEDEAKAEREAAWHPDAVGSCDLAIHVGDWASGDERRPA